MGETLQKPQSKLGLISAPYCNVPITIATAKMQNRGEIKAAIEKVRQNPVSQQQADLIQQRAYEISRPITQLPFSPHIALVSGLLEVSKNQQLTSDSLEDFNVRINSRQTLPDDKNRLALLKLLHMPYQDFLRFVFQDTRSSVEQCKQNGGGNCAETGLLLTSKLRTHLAKNFDSKQYAVYCIKQPATEQVVSTDSNGDVIYKPHPNFDYPELINFMDDGIHAVVVLQLNVEGQMQYWMFDPIFDVPEPVRIVEGAKKIGSHSSIEITKMRDSTQGEPGFEYRIEYQDFYVDENGQKQLIIPPINKFCTLVPQADSQIQELGIRHKFVHRSVNGTWMDGFIANTKKQRGGNGDYYTEIYLHNPNSNNPNQYYPPISITSEQMFNSYFEKNPEITEAINNQFIASGGKSNTPFTQILTFDHAIRYRLENHPPQNPSAIRRPLNFQVTSQNITIPSFPLG